VRVDRRTFLLGALAAAGAGVGAVAGARVLFDDDDRDGAPPTRRYGDVSLRQAAASDRPPVLFVSLDDCNDWLGYLNDHPGTHTPNIDALAATSLSFAQAYCSVPQCIPSRASLLFGRAPYHTGVYDHSDESRERQTAFARVTPALTDAFWAAGYDTYGSGKVFHPYEPARWTDYKATTHYASAWANSDEPERWDPEWLSPYDGRPIGDGRRFRRRVIDFGPSGRDPADEADGIATEWVRARLRERTSRPLFLALGFQLPHEPWRLPQRYFDLHPIDEVVVPEARPGDLDDLGPYATGEIVHRRTYERMYEAGVVPGLVQAYQAAISFVDDRLGIVLEELAASPYADEMIVVLWSDHGYHLGEKLHLEKYTLWERGTHVPFLLRVPGRFDRGDRFERPVSLLDLGPTLADLCDVELDPGHEGRSLLPATADPPLADDRPAIMTWQRGNHAVRRGAWRYIRYRTGERELYDRSSDPDELTNLAALADYRDVVADLDRFVPTDDA